MSEVLLALGPFNFYATHPSFEKLKFEADFRWAKQDRLGREPAMQFLGPGERTVNLDGVLYPEAFSGGDILSNMNAAARSGATFPLIAMRENSLTGDFMGQWVIMKITNTRSFFGANGARKIEFDVTLKSYGGDGVIGGGLF